MQIRKITGLTVVLALAAFTAAGCGNSIPKNSICSVNGDAIAKSDYNTLVNQAKKSYTTQGQKFPKQGTREYDDLKKNAVNYLIEQKLYAQQADKLGVTVKDKDVTKRLDQLKKSFFKGDEKKYTAELKKQGVTEKEVKENLRQQLLTERLYNKVTKNVTVSDAKAEAYFKENPTQYQTPESRQVAHILVKTLPEANKIYAQVKGGDKVKFAALAKKFSQDPSSAQQGGVLTVNKGQTVPEFDAESFKLNVGEISKPVKTQFGYHIITARGPIVPAKKQAFNDVKATIKQTLSQEQKTKRMQEWRDTLRKKSEKDVNCLKSYPWTQTVKSTATTPPASSTPPASAPTSGAKTGSTKGGSTPAPAPAGAPTGTSTETGTTATTTKAPKK